MEAQDATGLVNQRNAWFLRDRFGLFVHPGIYSVAARHEWIKNRERITDG